MTDAVTGAPARDEDVVEALDLLALSGRLNRAVASLDGDERQAARGHRRMTAIAGMDALATAFDLPGDTVPGDPDALSAARAWLAEQSSAQDADAPSDDWLMRALALLDVAAASADHRARAIAVVLIRSVIRPLCEAGYRWTPGIAAPLEIEPGLVALAQVLDRDATANDPSVREAAAALSRLIANGPLANDAAVVEMTARLASRQPLVTVSTDGPYLFEGAAGVVDHLGIPIEVAGRAAFCRCGKSMTKPYCDGTHATLGFSGDKDAHRIAAARDMYVGQQATVFDNRGLCAHSGFCTDRLNSVFHVGQEPFVTPSGGRMDDIMRAVRRCPSGALSFGIEGKEFRDVTDEPRTPMIEVSKDGPYRITGGIALVDAEVAPIPRDEGASLEHYSLCRCGSSLNKPFCSGMHWSVSFVDPRPDPEARPTLFEWAGGYPALLEMTRLFYSRHVPSDPLVGPLFATMEADHPERVAAWLSEVFGGPKFYSERYGDYNRMISQHLNKHLTQEQRSHWASLMAQSADEAGLPNDAEFRAAFMGYIEWGSRIAVENSQSDAKPPPNMPVPRWWWVCNAEPGSRISALGSATETPSEVPLPILQPGERPSFAKHIKDLFRPMDRNSMRFAFDLWAYEDVRAHADAILGRVKAGTMPCDKAWAPEKVSLFRQWVDNGTDA